MLKNWVKSHKRLLSVVKFVLGKNKKELYYSWGDIIMMVDDWCRFLPKKRFDCIIGIPRSGLMVANQIALNFGLPVSTPDNFIVNIVWQTKSLELCTKFKYILVIEDCVQYGHELQYEIQRLRDFFPDIIFEIGALVDIGYNCKLDYCYVIDKTFLNPCHAVIRGNIVFEDF